MKILYYRRVSPPHATTAGGTVAIVAPLCAVLEVDQPNMFYSSFVPPSKREGKNLVQ